jgi:hypothetical protein
MLPINYTTGYPLGVFPYDKTQAVQAKTTGAAIINYQGSAPVTDRFEYRPEALYANGNKQTIQAYLEQGINALYQQGNGNNSAIASLNAKTAIQTGAGNRNNLDIHENLATLRQTGKTGTINQTTVLNNLDNAQQEGKRTENFLEVGGTLGSLTMAGTDTSNTLNHYGNNADLILQAGRNNTNNILQFSNDANGQTGTVNQFVSGTTNSYNQSTFNNVKEGLLEGSGNTHALTTWGTLDKIALKGDNNDFTISANSGIGKLGAVGENQQGKIFNFGNTNTPSEAYLNGNNSAWQYIGDGQQQVFVGGKNNHVTVVTSDTTDKKGLNQNDYLVLAGKGSNIIAETGAGNDTVKIKLADGMKAELEGGIGKNTLILEKGNWKTKRLADGTTVYMRTGSTATGTTPTELQVIKARNFGAVQYVAATPASAEKPLIPNGSGGFNTPSSSAIDLDGDPNTP